MDPKEVRARIDDTFSSQFQNEFSRHPSDYFLRAGVTAHFDARGRLEFIELFRPVQAMLDGTDLLGMNFRQALAFLRTRDPSAEMDADGGLSKALGIGFWTSRGDDDHDLIEHVYVFRDGYYDQ